MCVHCSALPSALEVSLTSGAFFRFFRNMSDKLSLLHIKGTQRGGEHGSESRQPHGGAEGTKSDRGVVYVLLIALVKNVLRNLANQCFGMK